MIYMYKANEIALWFLYKNNAEIKEHISEDEEYEVYEGITHLKLQKLLYYAQGVFLSMNGGNKLFSEKIMAWEHGPVVEEVYFKYKDSGRNNIEVVSNSNSDAIIRKIENDSNTSNILNMVYSNFAIYTAWQLREMTHEIGTPWDITVKKDGLNHEIKTKLIKDYFDKVVME